ncbi:MAG: GNAT family N-acetyltransferase [Candidatus Hodarchaeales archaeon]|jgi:CelD/BcsL family acetyltransferase involved in cellulose biosynthesis
MKRTELEWIRILEITELDDFHRFEDLKDVWNDVLTNSGWNDVFSTYEWMSSWWKAFGERRQPRILLAKDKDKVLGIAPFMRTKYNFLHFGNLTKIEFIGCPQSDYSNFLLVDKETECLQLFFDNLKEHNDWDCLELREIPQDNVLIDTLRKMASEESIDKFEESQISLCPHMSLPTSIDGIKSKLKGNMRRNLRRRLKRLNEKFRVEFKTQNDFDSVEEAMNVFFKLHQKRWQTKGAAGVFARQELQNFHLDVAKLFNEKGWLSLHFLTTNDEAIATVYSFDYGQKKYEYLTGFNPDYSQFGIGNLLRMHLVEDCIRKGFKEYDLMRGNEPYKSEWPTQNRTNLEVRHIQKGFSARMYGWATRNRTALFLTEKIGQSMSPK